MILLYLLSGKEHPFYDKKYLTVQELNHQENMQSGRQESGTRQLFEDFAVRHGISYEIAWEANSPGTLLNAVLNDQILSVMSLQSDGTGNKETVCPCFLSGTRGMEPEIQTGIPQK